MNLNDLARKVTLKEGKKRNLNIGDVKEVMKITFQELAKKKEKDVLNTIKRYKKKR